MRFSIPALLSLAVALIGVASATSTKTQIEASASFPESNQFGRVVNGEKNVINVLLENKGESEVELTAISGSFENPDTGKLLRNTTTLPFKGQLSSGVKQTVPYPFYSEFKPQDVRLQIFAHYKIGGETHHVQAYNSIISIVEPPASIFDVTLIVTYLLIIAILGGGAYLLVAKYFPRQLHAALSKKPKAFKAAPSAARAKTASTKGYEPEWIPQHILKADKLAKAAKLRAKKNNPISSGDESGVASGVASGNEKRKKKST
ncbi:uncharacterized protein EI90DRAFT_3151189 [Cantharellus anzutake]|uniref:uncharacterized protein n=1 Tax=Cantharellus anzutake TaxID=1750568 RepID=UPI0019061FA2|nr:uncharacterized protein EI90DRAFT_3151189 [Cantharellus anzutake]KAF8339717.1 hypothetical protein EI90DRAFT_3151189 [Cantharellus anzutake]